VGFAFRLTIAGACPDPALAAELRGRIAAHPRAAWLDWEDGFVGEARMETLLRESDALVLPYRRIDQSGVLLQALRWGLPVVASRVGAFEDYVGGDGGELCEPGDAGALARALERLQARSGRIDRDALREAARRFDWAVTVRALRPVYLPD